jgi:Uma2 family endonuclease
MTPFLQLTQDPELDQLYPSSDGQPMAENTRQYRWIVLIKENLELILAAVENVFIAADLLWYPFDIRTLPADQRPKVPPSAAPDVMVVFGRPKGDRPSYRQWMEENLSPQVVFEILSDSNRTPEGREQLQRKFEFYQQYGVEEYYIYDPDLLELQGWRRQGQYLRSIEQLSGWISPRLKIIFRWELGEELVLFRPDGQRFLSFLEIDELAQAAHQEAQAAHQEAQAAYQAAQAAYQQVEIAHQQVEAAQQEAEQERSRANQAQVQAEAAEQALKAELARSQQMAALLRSMGIDPEQLPTLPLETLHDD